MMQSTIIIQSDIRIFPLGNLAGPHGFFGARREIGSPEALFEYETIPAVVRRDHIDRGQYRVARLTETVMLNDFVFLSTSELSEFSRDTCPEFPENNLAFLQKIRYGCYIIFRTP